MRHRSVVGRFFDPLLCAVVLCIALLAGPASGVSISYVDDLRYIYAFGFNRYPDFNSTSAMAQPSPEFSDFSDGVVAVPVGTPACCAYGEAWQVSLLNDAWMYAHGYARAEYDALLYGRATSVFHVVFTVDETAPWRLEGLLARASNNCCANVADAQVILSSGGTVLFAIALPPATGDPDPLSVPVFASGELTPGEYDLLIEATAYYPAGEAANPGVATFNLFFYVPEPGTGLLVITGLLGLAARRHRFA